MAASLKNKVKGYLGQLSQNLEQLKGSMELAKATRSDQDIKRMEEYQKKAEESLDKVVDLTIEINVLEPATGAETVDFGFFRTSRTIWAKSRAIESLE